jgi:O-antigen biosynthesis protein WbqP
MSFGFDCKCFFGTVKSVLKSDGVVEGGTGELEKQKKERESAEQENKEDK